MFHTIITLAYIIPNIYVFIRIWMLFINKGYKVYYTLIYLLIASIYPISNLFNEADQGFLPAVITKAGNYILPFYLYLFLIVLAFDLILLLNIRLKMFSFEKIKSTSFRKTGLSAIIILSLSIVIAGIINFRTIRISAYQISIPGKSSRIGHLKIAFAADFHINEGTDKRFVKRFVKSIRQINPDILLFGGDIVEGDREDENMSASENLLRDIKTKYGTFTVLGNHEYYGGQDKGSFFDKAGIRVLCDTVMVIDSSFNLGGRYDIHFKGRKSINDLMKLSEESLPVILVDHRPTEIDQVSRTAVDVQFSGHTHNGQLFPINLITKRIYPLSWGYMKRWNTHFFVTSGIQLWGPPVRTTGKSEIMVVDISFSYKGF